MGGGGNPYFSGGGGCGGGGGYRIWLDVLAKKLSGLPHHKIRTKCRTPHTMQTVTSQQQIYYRSILEIFILIGTKASIDLKKIKAYSFTPYPNQVTPELWAKV